MTDKADNDVLVRLLEDDRREIFNILRIEKVSDDGFAYVAMVINQRLAALRTPQPEVDEVEQWQKVYFEIADAIDLLDNTTAAEGSEDSMGQAELCLERAREHMISRPQSDETETLRAEVARLREALGVADAAIKEMFRYYDGGETRGSYDGKPERNQLRKAGYATTAALKGTDYGRG